MEKSRKIAACCLASLMALTGCTSSKDILSTDEGKLTADEMTNNLKSGSREFNFTFQKLLDTKFPETADMKKISEESYKHTEESYKQQYGKKKYRTQLRNALQTSGMSSKADFIKQDVNYQQEMKMLDYYVKHNFDSEFEVYWKKAKPRLVSVITVTLKKSGKMNAKEKDLLYNKISNDIRKEGFAKAAKKYSETNSTARGDIGVVDKLNKSSVAGLSDDMVKKIYKMKKGQTSDVMVNLNQAVIVHLDSTDKNTVKKRMKKNAGVSSPMVSYDSSIRYRAFLSFNIKYSDAKMKKDVEKYAKGQANQ